MAKQILIWGLGAIGSSLAGFLKRSGHHVVAVGRAGHLQETRKQLQVKGIWGEFAVTLDALFPPDGDVAAYYAHRGIAPDWILLPVRSYQTAEVARQIKGVWERFPSSRVCSMQNGLGNMDKLAQFVPPERIFGGRVIYGARIPQPGQVEITVYAEPVLVGCQRPSQEGQTAGKGLAELLNASGIPARYTSDIGQALWGKLLYNAALNPLATILGVNYGQLLAEPTRKGFMRKIIEEIYQLKDRARGQGHAIHFPEEDSEAYLRLLFEELVPRTHDHFPSMLQMIQKGQRTEIDALNGYVVSLAHELGLQIPYNEAVVEAIHSLESSGTIPPSFKL